MPRVFHPTRHPHTTHLIARPPPSPPPAPPSAPQVFDKVAPGLRVNDEGVATWEGVPFMTSAGPCTAVAAKGGLIK